MAFDTNAYRAALGHFPTGVVIVTAPVADRDPVAMTVSSFNSVSLEPPLVLFSVSRTAPSLTTLLAAPRFAISVLRRDQHELSNRFSQGRENKWGDLTPAHTSGGCPIIQPNLATFECRIFASHEGGDHRIIVGHVEEFTVSVEGDPLVFFRGGYRSLAIHMS